MKINHKIFCLSYVDLLRPKSLILVLTVVGWYHEIVPCKINIHSSQKWNSFKNLHLVILQTFLE